MCDSLAVYNYYLAGCVAMCGLAMAAWLASVRFIVICGNIQCGHSNENVSSADIIIIIIEVVVDDDDTLMHSVFINLMLMSI